MFDDAHLSGSYIWRGTRVSSTSRLHYDETRRGTGLLADGMTASCTDSEKVIELLSLVDRICSQPWTNLTFMNCRPSRAAARRRTQERKFIRR